jgi:uncharacterized membrane protein
MADEDAFTLSFRKQYPVGWWASLLGPPLVTAAILNLIWAVGGADEFARVVGAAAAAFFFFGRFVILGGHGAGSEVEFLSPGQLALMVIYMDMVIATLLVCHSGFLFKLPWLGRKLLALVEDGQFILRSNPWMKRVTFIGLVAFVAFPLAATGSVGGSILGRLLGMSRTAALTGIAAGSMLGCGVMYFGASVINRYIDRDNPLLTIGGIVVVAAIIVILNARYQKHKKRATAGDTPPKCLS